MRSPGRPAEVTRVGDVWWVGDTAVGKVHPASSCRRDEACVIHRPTIHHMAKWPIFWREDRGIVERMCEHGVGHPDPDQWPYWRRMGRMHEQVHGCCGCCTSPS
jgi:hypothetical protein